MKLAATDTFDFFYDPFTGSIQSFTNYNPDLNNSVVNTGNWFTDTFGDLIDAIPDIATAYFQYQQGKSLMKINEDRLKAGLQPLSAQQIQAYRPSAAVGLTSDTQNTILMLGGLALVAVLGFALLSKKR